MSKKEIKPVGRKADIVIQEFDNEILIYDLTIHKAFSLNETSAIVWQACDGNKTVSEISRQISSRLNSPVTEDFVWLALDGLKKENLIENSREVPTPFEGLSRRAVIRKVGFASMIALPVISSLIAPTAAHAQSGLGAIGAACTLDANCVSDCCAGGTCSAAGAIPRGSACTATCQCTQFVGNPSICFGGTCVGRTQV